MDDLKVHRRALDILFWLVFGVLVGTCRLNERVTKLETTAAEAK